MLSWRVRILLRVPESRFRLAAQQGPHGDRNSSQTHVVHNGWELNQRFSSLGNGNRADCL